MKTAMGNGTSALLSFQKAMAVESHNAGNTKSLAYKTDKVSFADMFYTQSVGLGVSMNTPIKDFSQGGLLPTDSQYDFAIDGEGFFQMQDPLNPTQTIYSRAGQFKSDKENFLVDPNGMKVLGILPEVSGDVIRSEHTNEIASIIIETDESIMSLNTYSTNYKTAVITTGATGASGSGYKSVDDNLNDIEELIYEYNNALKAYSINPVAGDTGVKAQSVVSFPITPITNDEYTVEVLVNGIKIQQNFEESLENTLKLFSDKINQIAGITSDIDLTTGNLTITSMVSGKHMNVSQAKLNGSNLVATRIAQGDGTGKALVDAIYSDLQVAFSNVGAEIVTNQSSLNKLESGTLTGLEPLVLDLHTLGMNSSLYDKLISDDPEKIASYPGIESDDGYLYLRDGDSRFLIGKIPTVVIPDKSLLKPEGDSLYTLSDSDVVPVYVEGIAKVVGGYLEESNVDISEQLVNLLTFQKAFEANSKSISTSDEMMKTALALKSK